MTKTSISTNKTNKSKNQKKPFTIFQAEKRENTSKNVQKVFLCNSQDFITITKKQMVVSKVCAAQTRWKVRS